MQVCRDAGCRECKGCNSGEENAVFKDALMRCDKLCQDKLPQSLISVIYPRDDSDDDDPEALLQTPIFIPSGGRAGPEGPGLLFLCARACREASPGTDRRRGRMLHLPGPNLTQGGLT